MTLRRASCHVCEQPDAVERPDGVTICERCGADPTTPLRLAYLRAAARVVQTDDPTGLQQATEVARQLARDLKPSEVRRLTYVASRHAAREGLVGSRR